MVLMTTPLRPPSRINRLLPPTPIRVDGHVLRCNALRERQPQDPPGREDSKKSSSAGPPTCQDVCRLIGSLRFTRRENSGATVTVTMPPVLRPGHGRPGDSCESAASMCPRCCPSPITTTSPSRMTSASDSASSSTFSTEDGLELSEATTGRGWHDRWRGRQPRESVPLPPRTLLSPTAHRRSSAHLPKSSIEIARARIPMRLKRQDQAAIRVTLAQSLESRHHFGRVMSVVVDDGYAARARIHIRDVLQERRSTPWKLARAR